MAADIKIRAVLKDGITEIRALMIHPMETGRRKNDFDETIPAHFIQLVTVMHNDKAVLEAQWGTGVSKNPYLTFRLKGAKVGDKVSLQWIDNKGQSSSLDATVQSA